MKKYCQNHESRYNNIKANNDKIVRYSPDDVMRQSEDLKKDFKQIDNKMLITFKLLVFHLLFYSSLKKVFIKPFCFIKIFP